MKRLSAFVMSMFLLTSPLFAEVKPFSELVGPVKVGEVGDASVTQLIPYITWGAEYATFYANGGCLPTVPGTLFDAQGLKLHLTPGDDFIQQVRDYMTGKSPFLRGTMPQLAQASEITSQDPRTKIHVLVQMSFSQGDHCVFKPAYKNLDDLSKKIKNGGKVVAALQEGGPHVGMLDDLRQLIGAKWENFEVIWAKDLTGTDNSPATIFSKNPKVDICFVITPDMVTLTGGLDKTGDASGADGNFPGAHVGLSTATMNKSIVDVYGCREDFYQKNKEYCEKFVAAYLKSCDEIRKLAAAWEKDKKSEEGKEYYSLLQMAQKIYGDKTLPSIEGDAHGLFLDCSFAGIDGNIAFFKDAGNLQGFKYKNEGALAIAADLGYISKKNLLIGADFDYKRIATLGGIKYREPKLTPKFNAEIEVLPDEELDALKSFTINFDANKQEFDAKKHRDRLLQVVKESSLLGNSKYVISAHADTAMTLRNLVKAGLQKGILQQSGEGQNRKYYYKGKELDLTATKDICALIEHGDFDGVEQFDPRQSMIDAMQLTKARAENVRQEVLNVAKAEGLNIDPSQIKIQGVGIREPLIARPKTEADMAANRRVEFTVVQGQPAEATDSSVLDF